ncbi:MAG: rhodanese-like domain-containing protein, partial [Verrucomicrobiota bacterium]|nr:rhodanese-like domain-containing protein [Verrucomicrobiota bacterium]
MEQPNRFQKLVAEAKKHIIEISPNETKEQLELDAAIVIDVREEQDWREEHIEGAKHLSRGII